MKLTKFATIMGAGAAAGLFSATFWPTLFWPHLVLCIAVMVLVFVLMKLYPNLDK